MSEYHSIHPGEIIDEAVGRAKSGGELDLRINAMKTDSVTEINAAAELAIQSIRNAAQEVLNYLGGTFTLTDNPEYLAAWTDAEGRLLVGIRKDGTVYFAAGIPPQIADRFSELEAYSQAILGRCEALEEYSVRNINNLLNWYGALNDSAFTRLEKGNDGLLYAYNRAGNVVGGPYDFGTGGAPAVTTLAAYFNAVENDSVVYEEPTPVSSATLSPNRTLAGLLNAVPDDTFIYEEPTPISA